jgi:hypothetical protein
MTTNNFPLINGVNFGWSSITIRLLTVAIKGVSKITYKDEQEIEGQYGAGASAVSVGIGDIKYSGQIELYMETVQDLVKISPSGRIQDIPPFPITVSFLQNGVVINHTLLNCIFKSNGIDAKSGDKSVKTGIDLFIGEIKWK